MATPVVAGQLLEASDCNAINASTTAPTPTQLGQLWSDVSGSIPVLRVWDGVRWTRVGRSMDEFFTSFPAKVTTVLTGTLRTVWDSGPISIPSEAEVRMRLKIVATTSLLTTGSVKLITNGTTGGSIGVFSITSPITAGKWLVDLTIAPYTGLVQSWTASLPTPTGTGIHNVTRASCTVALPITDISFQAAAWDVSQFTPPFTITIGPVVLYTSPGVLG